MLIGITLGFILGIVLLLIGLIVELINKYKDTPNRWAPWVILAGGCAILTALFNNMFMLH